MQLLIVKEQLEKAGASEDFKNVILSVVSKDIKAAVDSFWNRKEAL
jgi:hypothetical protein